MTPPDLLPTSAGDVPLFACRLDVGGRTWDVRHTGAVVSVADEHRYLTDLADKLPYGVVLWPAAIALAHEVATRADEFRGATVLELGAGTGLPGIVAAALGATVTQTDRHELALLVCRQNGERNRVPGITYRRAEWADWPAVGRFDWVLGSDVLYAESAHPLLRGVLEATVAPGGRVLLADPFRAASLPLLHDLEAAGWGVRFNKWTVGDADQPRAVAVYEVRPPG